MKDYKELIDELRKCKYSAPNTAKYAADAIEHLVKDLHEALEDERHAEVYAMKMKENCNEMGKKLNHVITAYDNETVRAERLEAENRAKEQYIAETIGKVIKERDAAIADLRYQSACWNCTKNGKKCHASMPMEQPNVMCGGFEWRGVQEVEP